ncbi:MAG: radical SAM protein [archaeon]|nr:MAG: radical SAM protein [archaeon]
MGKRLDIKVGFKCNNNCVFCAQAHKRELGNQPTKSLKECLERAFFEDDCNEIVFTGGEPTIRKDFFDLVKFAKKLGYELIQVQSNGRMFFYEKFVQKSIKAGITEFALAIHGHNPRTHDFQTRSFGSFKQTFQGIKNLKNLDQHILLNSVITKINYKCLPDMVRMFINLEPDQFQFAFVHPVGNAWKNFDSVVPLKSEVKPLLLEALKMAKKSGYKPGKVMIEAFPPCLMPDYEKCCSELYMPDSETVDANNVIKDFGKWRTESGKRKFIQCKNCKYDLICEGPWKEYAEKIGSDEFNPVN